MNFSPSPTPSPARAAAPVPDVSSQTGAASSASAPEGRPVSNKTFPELVWSWLTCFRSIQLAIILLSLLALATLAGVLLPQEGLVETAQIKATFGSNFRMMKAMGLFSVYSSYWFIALEVLFFFNLLFGSFQWLKPAALAATRVVFCGPEHIAASPHRLTFATSESADAATARITNLLKHARYGVHQAPIRKDGARMLYAAKGSFSRLGPAVAHTGILLLLVASVYGAFFGFKAQKLAVPGETFRIQDSQMFRPNVDDAVWQGSVPSWQVRVNDFRIDYYPEGDPHNTNAPGQPVMAKQYYADLSILDAQGHEAKRQTISVNHPLSVGDVTIYQASFNPTGKLFTSINGQPVTLETNTTFMNRPVSMSELADGRALLAFPFFVQQDPGVTRNYVVFFLRDAHGFVGAKPGKMPPNLKLREGESGMLGGVTLGYAKPEISTGLQIKQGPEVPWMYLAYAIITLGTILCIFSQRRLWIAVSAHPDGGQREIRLLYKTNKARISFMKELKKLQAAVAKGCESTATMPTTGPEALSNFDHALADNASSSPATPLTLESTEKRQPVGTTQ